MSIEHAESPRRSDLSQKSAHPGSRYLVECGLTALGTGLGYWLAALVGLSFIPAGGGITPVWPPNGFALGVLLVLGYRRWPWALLGVAGATFWSNVATGRSELASLEFSAANVLDVLVGAAFFRYWHPAAASLTQRREAALLAAIAGPIMAMTGLLGGLVGAGLMHGGFMEEWEKWWTGGAVGVLLVTPATILLLNAFRLPVRLRPKRLLEAAGWLILHAMVCSLAFFVVPSSGRETLLSTAVYPYLTLVTLIFLTARFGPVGSVIACLIAAGYALVSHLPEVHGHLLPLSDIGTLISIQAFLAISALLGLYLGTQREERLIAQQALRESDERFRLLTLKAPSGIFLMKPDGPCTFVNDAACEMIGRDTASAMGHGWIASMHPDDRARAMAEWQEKTRRGEEFRLEFRFLHDNGETTWVIGMASPAHGHGDAITGYVGTLTNITPLKEAEARLRESEGRFQHMADAAPGMVWMSDAHGRRDYFNQAWLSYRGRRLDEERHEGWKTGVHPEDLERVSTLLDEAHKQRVPFSAEYRLQRHDGVYRFILGTAAPRYTPDALFLGFVGTCIDVTPLREAETARLAMQSQVLEAARVESIARLAAGVSHEFNNLLTSVLGNANLAQLEPGLSQAARDHLTRIEEGTLKASELTRKMLAFTGRAPSVRSMQSISIIVEDTLPLLRTSLPKRVSLDVRLAPDPPSVVADTAQIQQVLANLFTNAVEAVEDPGGTIVIATGWRMCDEEALRALGAEGELIEGSYVYLQVSDNGCGIPREIIERIFDPFFSTKFLGRGLGLAAAQGIVRGHGGWLSVTSTPGEGTTFTAYFPAAARPALRLGPLRTGAESQN